MTTFRRRFLLLFLISASLFGGCRLDPDIRPDSSASSRPALILVSLDGFHPDYLQRGLTPTLDRLAEHGTRAEWLIPSFPSKTFPNHYTLVTGLVPDHHGIIDNTMLDATLGRFTLSDRNAVSDGRWWGGEPLWITAHRHQLRSATYFWPGSEAAIGGIRPDLWHSFDASIPMAERVDSALAWLDLDGDEQVDLISLYFEHVDTAGHRHGPESAEVNAAIAAVDDAIARLAAGLESRKASRPANLVIVSDHGMIAVKPGKEVVLDDLIDPALLDITSLSEISGFNPRPGHEAEVRAALLRPHEGMTCHLRSDLPERWHYGSHPRVPEITCLLQEGWRIVRRDSFNPWKQAVSAPQGSHGYDPESPAMRAIFIANGPSFRQGLRVPAFQNIHVYSLLCRLLGITPAANDGHPSVTASMLIPASMPSPIVDQNVQP